MLLTLEEQKETLYASAQRAGLDVAKEDIAWQDGFADIDGLKIHYLDWGTAGKPPMLLLHGGMQTAHTWDLVAVALKRNFHVVAMDLRGHGDSEWSPDGDYNFTIHGKDALGLVEQLGWEKFVLVGLSMGGLTAISVAARHWKQLSALVIVDVGPELKSDGVSRIINFVRGPSELDSIDDFVQRALEHNPRRKPEQLRYSLTHNLRQLPNGKWTWKYDQRFSQRSTQDGKEAPAPPTDFKELWKLLEAIECPAMGIRGGESEVLSEEAGKKMETVMPNCRFVTVPKAGHTVPQDNASGFLAELEPFLAGLDLSS